MDTELKILKNGYFPEKALGRPVYVYAKDNQVKLYPEPDGEYEIIIRKK